MNLLETVKSFITFDAKDDKVSSEVEQENVVQDLSNDDIYTTGAFFDEDNTGIFGGSHREKAAKLEKQKQKIMNYRQLAKTPDVSDAIEEIVNEISFTLNDKHPLKIDVDEENDKIKEAIETKFDKVMKLMNIRKNCYTIVKNGYIDGKLGFHTAYGDKSAKEGIKAIKMIEPVYLYLDQKTEKFKYHNKDNRDFFQNSSVKKGQEYDREEIVIEDFGLFEDGINLSYLEYALKPANQLRTLEDLLIPMRFSRSISRRVFNIDIGGLPNKKGEQVMREMQNKFKYKKYYNVESGEISNQQHITSMVEDYWFANRDGGKGTQVDTLDETGNLGELDDILYMNKKLYKALFIPSNRISIDPDADKEYDYDTTQVTKEDIKFFMFVSRLRQVYTSAFKEILRRELIATGTLKDEEWDEYKEKIEISFVNENNFIDKMNIDTFMQKLDLYSTAQEYQGKLFPVEKILKDIFKMDDEEIKENFEMINKEQTNPLYGSFYSSDEEESSW